MTVPFHIRDHLAELAKQFQPAQPAKGPDLSWARRILDRHSRGQKIKAATLQMARDALGMKEGA